MFRKRIAEIYETETLFSEEAEVDESYFGAKRVRGKRDLGASRKTPVFGILQRKGKVYIGIVPDCAKGTLQAICVVEFFVDSVFSFWWLEGL